MVLPGELVVVGLVLEVLAWHSRPSRSSSCYHLRVDGVRQAEAIGIGVHGTY